MFPSASSFLVLFALLDLVQCQSGGLWFLRVAVEPEVELCGPTGFYCPSSKACVPRDQRCTSSSSSTKTDCADQRKCYSVSWNPHFANRSELEENDDRAMENRFFLYRAYSSILDSGSGGFGMVRGAARAGPPAESSGTTPGPPISDLTGSPELESVNNASSNSIFSRWSIYLLRRQNRQQLRRRKRNVRQALRTLWADPWKHSFVQYRGFVYEFGKYGVQELDVNDPKYKYDREITIGWEIVGVSACVRADLWRFVRKWNFRRGNYLWYANNCHHFTNAFIQYVKDGCVDDQIGLD